MTEQYKCPSYYDANSVLQDCTCGKCGSKADWLRSEIERVEDAKLPLTPAELVGIPNTKLAEMRETHNHALTSIITRYKEELLELENGK